MGHLPIPASGQVPSSRPSLPGARIPQLEPVAVIASLRAKLSARTYAPDALFRAIADSARALTGAEGVALALLTSGSVVCRARSGNLAPAIGAELNSRSGISGECLRTSRALRCDDTQTDDRVDPEVCRNLGIRSIAVVPLRGHDGTVGILEAFSARSYAFGAEQVSLLKRLAEIAQSAYQAECGATNPALEQRTEPASYSRIRRELFQPSPADARTVARSNDHRVATEPVDRRSPSTRRYWIAGATVFFLLTAGVIWTTWQEPDEDGSSPQQVTQPQKASDEPAVPSGPPVIPWKPPAGWLKVRANQARHRQTQSNEAQLGPTTAEPLLRNVAEIETDNRPREGDADAGKVVVQESISSAQRTPDAPGSAIASPPEGASPTNTDALRDLASTPTTLPASDLRVSQGVSEATLVRKVEPLYPAEARSLRLEGSVVLDLTIEEDGSTRDLKVVSGPPILAYAATDAIRQWRYRPALLNGKPVAVQKQITVIFRTP